MACDVIKMISFNFSVFISQLSSGNQKMKITQSCPLKIDGFRLQKVSHAKNYHVLVLLKWTKEVKLTEEMETYVHQSVLSKVIVTNFTD